MVDKLIITNNGIQEESFTEEELAQREAERLEQIEREKIESLIPTQKEIENAEFQIKLLTTLTEIGVIS